MTTKRRDVILYKFVAECRTLEEVFEILDKKNLSNHETNKIATHWKIARQIRGE